MSELSAKILHLPAVPGVYLFKDARGQVLYVGKAKSLATRVRNYLSDDPQRPSMRDMIERAADLDTIVTATEVEALMLESTLIRQHKPHFNVLLKDDKGLQPADNPIALVSKDKATKGVINILDSVNAKLDSVAYNEMARKVLNDNEDPATVVADWLQRVGLT